MYYVYFLKSRKRDYIYIGSTNDLKRRLKERNTGEVYATEKYFPFDLVYYEAYLNRKDALNREYKLKHHGSAIGHLKKRLKYSLREGEFAKRAGLK